MRVTASFSFLRASGENGGEDLSDGAGDQRRLFGIALEKRRGEVARLLEGNMRRQRRHFGVRLDFQHHGPVTGERLVPGAREPRGIVDENALQADQLREA